MSDVPNNEKDRSADIEALPLAEFPGYGLKDPIRLHVTSQVYEDVLAHALESDRVELCGVLVGTACRDDEGPFLLVTGSIRGQHAENKEAQVTFTQETWAHIYGELDETFPGEKIVGWYHTHPGFGIFLSPMDMFIHENFFDLPWQVAWVVDPVGGEQGVFCWSDSEVVRLKRFWVGTEERDHQTIGSEDQSDLDEDLERLQNEITKLGGTLSAAERKVRRLRRWCLVYLIVLVGLLLWEAWTAFFHVDPPETAEARIGVTEEGVLHGGR